MNRPEVVARKCLMSDYHQWRIPLTIVAASYRRIYVAAPKNR
jgi:hypothetical protein